MASVTVHCGECGQQHDLALLAGLLSPVSDGPASVWCPTCCRVTRLDIRRPAEVPA